MVGAINLWDDPAFVSPDAGDFHIGSDSAAIDAGVDAGAECAPAPGRKEGAHVVRDVAAFSGCYRRFAPARGRQQA